MTDMIMMWYLMIIKPLDDEWYYIDTYNGAIPRPISSAVELFTCNEGVGGSTPSSGSKEDGNVKTR
jgi:hypothetical protein